MKGGVHRETLALGLVLAVFAVGYAASAAMPGGCGSGPTRSENG